MKLKSLKRMVLAAALVVSGGAGLAQDYPSKPVRIVGPFGAGASGDITARLIAEYFGRRFNQSFIVENRPGGGGLLGMNEAKRAPADGYTLLMGYDAITSFSLFVKDNTLDPVKDFAPISMVVKYPLALLGSNATLPARTIGELVAYAKANPKKINFAIITNAPGHLYGLVLFQKAGIDVTMIPYQTAAALTAAMMSGESHLTMSLYGSFIGGIRDGRISALGITSPTRMRQAPEVPTFREAGQAIDAAVWFALFAPAGTPPPALTKLVAASQDWVKQPNVIATAEKLAMELVGSTPAELAKVIQEDVAARAEAARIGKIVPQ